MENKIGGAPLVRLLYLDGHNCWWPILIATKWGINKLIATVRLRRM